MDEQQVAGASMRSKVNALPSGLTRFLFYSARPIERQAKIEGPFGGYKRSSSALDSLTGVTLGKRSSGSMELVNWEPLFARQYSMRSPPRMYDMRWAPLDSLDTPAHEQYNWSSINVELVDAPSGWC